MRDRYFTPAEANASLPQLTEQLSRLQQLVGRLQEAQDTIRRRAEESGLPLDQAISSQEADVISTTHDEAQAIVDGLTEAGIEVKDAASGLIDFPALRSGREVYLCWKLGEGAVEFWHPLHTGAAGRQWINPQEDGVWEWFN